MTKKIPKTEIFSIQIITSGFLSIAIVLIHGKCLSRQYHWVVYPIDNVKEFYGKKTVIDTIYLLKWKGKGK